MYGYINSSPTRVHPAVVLHVVSEFESFAAEFTLERSVSRVHGEVRYERRHVGKTFAAKLAEHDVAGLHRADVQVGRRVVRRREVRGLRELAHDERQGPREQGVAVLERVERVRGQNVPRQFAPVGEGRATVYARMRPLPLLYSPPTGPFVLLQRQKEHQLLFPRSFRPTRVRNLTLRSKWRCDPVFAFAI